MLSADTIDTLERFGTKLGTPMLILLLGVIGVWLFAKSTYAVIVATVNYLFRSPVIADGEVVDSGGWGHRILNALLEYVVSAREHAESNTRMLVDQKVLMERQLEADSKLHVGIGAISDTLRSIVAGLETAQRNTQAEHVVLRASMLHLARMLEVMAQAEQIDVSEPVGLIRQIIRTSSP